MSFFQGTFLTGTKWITAPDQVNGVLNRARAKKQQNCLFLLKKIKKSESSMRQAKLAQFDAETRVQFKLVHHAT